MKKIGFTLIELLVVIAIIAILAAIIFPAAISAKDAAYRSSDMSHLNELRTALQLYRTDQGAYPPELLGYVETYASGTQAGQIIPADQIQGYLFPKRVPAISSFQPAYDRTPTTTVVGGQLDTSGGSGSGLVATKCGTQGAADPSTIPDTSCVYWPGPPVSATTTSANCRGQAFGDDMPVYNTFPSSLGYPSVTPVQVPEFYQVDGYDVAPEPDASGVTKYVIHYSLFWSGFGLGLCSCVSCPGGPSGAAGDSITQLGYVNPPDNTVITWDSYFRNYEANHQPEQVKRDVVLFLGGNAKMYDSHAVYENTFNISP